MTKALVLSGGGPVGIAWQTGLAAGLARQGVSLADADLIVGTSAGSAVGAQIALGRDMEAVLARYRRAGQTGAAPPAGAPRGGTGGGGGPMGQAMAKLMELMAAAASSDAPAEEARAAIGRFALEAATGAEEGFVGGFRYLAGEAWPRRYRATAVDAETGEFVVWDGSRGEALDRAVASSCAVPGVFPPVTVNGRRYIDGGMRSGTNADLAAGHRRVLVVTLMGANRAGRADARMQRYLRRMEEEQAAITAAGGQVRLLGPDPASASVMGLNLMDRSIGPAAAEAGAAQGEAAAAGLAGFWA